MRPEHDWKKIRDIALGRNTCIKPSGMNYDKAEEDFRQFPGKVRYYSFPVIGEQRGYLRFLVDNKQFYLDFASPWGHPATVNALRSFTQLTSRIGRVVIPVNNIQSDLKESALAETTLDLSPISGDLKHKGYIVRD